MSTINSTLSTTLSYSPLINMRQSVCISHLILSCPGTDASFPQYALTVALGLNLIGSGLVSALPAPGPQGDGNTSLLDKYQGLSNAASAYVGAQGNGQGPTTGNCSTAYPCSSISRVGSAHLAPTSAALDDDQVSTLLNHMTASATLTLDHSDPSTVLSGMKLSTGVDGTTVAVIGPPGTIDSQALAGMVWDMYKAADPAHNNVNVVRATDATGAGQLHPMLALCLYPTALEGDAVRSYCMARGEGATPQKRGVLARDVQKRSLFDSLCSAIDIPIICSIF